MAFKHITLMYNLGSYIENETANMKKFKDFIKEMGAGAVAAGPTNVVGGGAIAGTGGKGGEPGVDLRNRRKRSPIMMGMGSRKPPKI